MSSVNSAECVYCICIFNMYTLNLNACQMHLLNMLVEGGLIVCILNVCICLLGIHVECVWG